MDDGGCNALGSETRRSFVVKLVDQQNEHPDELGQWPTRPTSSEIDGGVEYWAKNPLPQVHYHSIRVPIAGLVKA